MDLSFIEQGAGFVRWRNGVDRLVACCYPVTLQVSGGGGGVSVASIASCAA